MSEDRRGAYRRNAFTIGAVQIAASAVECLVWDVNETGALIEIDSAASLPERIQVRLGPDAPLREASVAWREGKRAGLNFA